MNNQEVSGILKEIAAAYEIKGGDKFKIMAYDRAATAVHQATNEIKDLWKEGKLETLPGIGKAIAGHLDELFKTGQVKHFKRVKKGLSPAFFVLLKIPGVGPKTAHKLCIKLNINQANSALSRLKRAVQKGEIRKIKGFSLLTEKEILLGIIELERRKPRLLLPQATNISQKIIVYLKNYPHVEAVFPLGSLRRGCATIGDIDLAVKTDSSQGVIDYFVNYPEVKKIVNQGRTKASVLLKNNCQVDLRAQKKSFGAMLQYFTGSKNHNIHLREYARRKGLSLSEYGIKVRNKLKECEKEHDFYRFLGMDWVPPELREDKGEIEAALNHNLPFLLNLRMIRGEFHTHSNFQFREQSYEAGKNSFRQIINQAINLGYDYIGLADHSLSKSKHNDEDVIALLSERKRKIEQIIMSIKNTQNKSRENNREIKIYNILEIDIDKDGFLYLPSKAWDYLDFAFVSVHTSFKMDRKTMTKRILKALHHPKVKFLAHPTGRLLGKREGYELDWASLFEFCRKNDKWLEINSQPERLDLPDDLVRQAVQSGVKLVIGSDAHEIEDMSLIRYGVQVARRGWAQAKDIINTLSVAQLDAIIEN